MTLTPIEIVLTSNLDKKNLIQVQVKTLSSSERLLKALKQSGKFLLIAVCCIFIPMAHFVLVPTFSLTAIYFFFSVIKKENLLIGAEVICPQCDGKFPAGSESFNWPMRVTCPHCQSQLQLDLVYKT
jgi:hypothetical protein